MTFLFFVEYFFVWYFSRFLIFASLVYFFFWLRPNGYTAKYRIQNTDFTPHELKRDFLLSILSCLVFGLCLASVSMLRSEQVYNYIQLSNFGFNAFNIKIPLNIFCGWFLFLVILHETYFYWLHRLLHLPFFYKKIHKVHHYTKNPNPFTTQTFHPLEAVMGILWVVLATAFLKIPMSVWVYYSVFNAALNVLGHCGLDFFPANWETHPILKYVNRPTMHNHHHKYNNGNYGFYFTFWDRWMGTYKPN